MILKHFFPQKLGPQPEGEATREQPDHGPVQPRLHRRPGEQRGREAELQNGVNDTEDNDTDNTRYYMTGNVQQLKKTQNLVLTFSFIFLGLSIVLFSILLLIYTKRNIYILYDSVTVLYDEYIREPWGPHLVVSVGGGGEIKMETVAAPAVLAATHQLNEE